MTNFKRKKPIKKYLRGGCSCGWTDEIASFETEKKKLLEWELEEDEF
jgi:hypothetical protein